MNPEVHLKTIVDLLQEFACFWYYRPDEYVIQHLFDPKARFFRDEWHYLFVTLGIFDLKDWIHIVKHHEVFVENISELGEASNIDDKNNLPDPLMICPKDRLKEDQSEQAKDTNKPLILEKGIEFKVNTRNASIHPDNSEEIWIHYKKKIEEHSKYACESTFSMENLKDAFLQFLNLLKRLKQLQLDIPQSNSFLNIPSHLKRGMKLKKLHEVERLADLVCKAIEENGVTDLVDIGAGQGYLTQTVSTLCSKEELSVIALDNNEDQIEGSKVRVRKIAQRSIGDENDSRGIKHITCHLSQDGHEFKKYVHSALSCENPRVLVMGLHCCGDLSVTCLNLFTKDSKVTSLVNIGCCYHKISEPFGFPLSNQLKNRTIQSNESSESTFRLTSGGLSLACISPQKWTADNSVHQFKQHSFRCALELFLKENAITKCNYVGHVRKSQTNSFADYSKWAIMKMKEKAIQDNNSSSADLLDKLLQKDNLAQQLDEFYESLQPESDSLIIPSVKIFWCLRALMSPLIESVILLDRYIYLREQHSGKIEMFRIFDENLSPRNTVIIAQKSDD